jgi:uncharacterized membrane protein YccF (DUF307 family)
MLIDIFNVLWFILFGWESALVCLVFGGLFSITIVGLPIGKALINLAKIFAFPYGKEVVRAGSLHRISGLEQVLNFILNAVWFPVGLVLTVAYAAAGLLAILTVIGAPVGIVMLKLGQFLLFPVGAKVVDRRTR